MFNLKNKMLKVNAYILHQKSSNFKLQNQLCFMYEYHF